MRVALGTQSHAVEVGSGVIEQLPQFLKSAGLLEKTSSRKVFVFADEKLTEARARVAQALQKAHCEVHEYPVTAGEGLKDFSQLPEIYSAMVQVGMDRRSFCLALGGGSIGDAAGFVASTYMRGVPWVGVPTTLLAQVDSSIGGKTAVNTRDGKNLIGTFHQPRLVVCETDFLKTLSDREIISGFGEIVKYGLCFDPQFYSYLQNHWQQMVELHPKVLNRVILSSLRFKAKIVSRDVFDLKGVREVLNFGHTFGHALEGVTHYQTFQHGEAILWGMRFAVALSQIRRHLSLRGLKEISEFLMQIPVPALPSGISPESYFKLMKKDKKQLKGRVRFVLLQKLGKTCLDHDVEESHLRAAFEMMMLGEN